MISDADVDVLTDENGDDTTLSSDIWWIEVEVIGNVWSDGTDVFLNGLLVINIWVVGLSDLKEFV